MKRASRGADSDQSGKKNEGAKSELTVLAEKFKQQFCTQADIGKDVNLNDVADSLQVSRRRLYDIVNVLEALQMVGRSGKLTYRWEGTAHLPRLLALLYSDAVASAESGQSNPAILEGHMPGSCWALTRRIVQQLLLDRSQVPLTLLVQRLETALAASQGSTAGSSTSAGKASLATVERRIYDIGSVLSTFDLVSKTLQGGSGPRHRQPVYQWQVDWESQLPADVLQAVFSEAAAGPAAGAGPATASAAAAAHAAYAQQWQPYQTATAGAVHQSPVVPHMAQAAAAASPGQMLPVLVQYHHQQQLHPGAAAAAMQAHPLLTQQQALQAEAAAASDAMQQRLQHLDQLVSTVLAQHGDKTCVTMSQLKSLLQQLQAGCQEQTTAPGALPPQQQQQQHPGHVEGSPGVAQDDQDQLDAAECLQQLAAGPTAEQQQPADQQQKVTDAADTAEDAHNRQLKRQKCCPDAVPESNDQCCPGMTCFDLGAALHAAAAATTCRAAPSCAQPKQGQQQQTLSQFDALLQQQSGAAAAVHQQQQKGKGHVCMAVDSPYLPAATAAAGQAEQVDSRMEEDEADLNDGVHDQVSSSEQIDDPTHDFAAFAADEGEEAPGVRVGSNTLNNGREGAADAQALPATAEASLQQQRAAEAAGAVQGGQQEDRECDRQMPGQTAAAAGGQQQYAYEPTVPWVAGTAAEASGRAPAVAAAAAAMGVGPANLAADAQRLNPLLQAVQGLQPQQKSQLLMQLLESARRGAGAHAMAQQAHSAVQPSYAQQQQQHVAGEGSQQCLVHVLRTLVAQREGALAANAVPQQQQQQHSLDQQQQHQQMLTDAQKEQLLARLCSQQQQQYLVEQQQQGARPTLQRPWQALHQLQQLVSAHKGRPAEVGDGGQRPSAVEQVPSRGSAEGSGGANSHQWLLSILQQRASAASGTMGSAAGVATAAPAAPAVGALEDWSLRGLSQSNVNATAAAATMLLQERGCNQAAVQQLAMGNSPAASVVAAAAHVLAAAGPQAATAAAALSSASGLPSADGWQHQHQQLDTGNGAVAGPDLDRIPASMLLQFLQAQRR